MKTTVHQNKVGDVTHIVVALSRRNLLSLLAKLDGHGSGSSHLEGPTFWTPTTILAEEDDVHYDDPDREAGPGVLHPRTEAALAGRDTRKSGLDQLVEDMGYRIVSADGGAIHYVKDGVAGDLIIDAHTEQRIEHRCGGNCNDYTGCDGTCGARIGKR